MKTQILLDTTFIPTYEMYVEFCEDNNKLPQNEDSNDYWDFVEFEREIEVNDFFINLNGSKVNNNHYWVISGSLGLWDGRKEIALVKCDTLFDAILKCVNSCDDFVVEKCGNKVCVTAMHHDGRNYFEIRALSNVGNDRFNRLGNISLNNRENFVKLEKYLF